MREEHPHHTASAISDDSSARTDGKTTDEGGAGEGRLPGSAGGSVAGGSGSVGPGPVGSAANAGNELSFLREFLDDLVKEEEGQADGAAGTSGNGDASTAGDGQGGPRQEVPQAEQNVDRLVHCFTDILLSIWQRFDIPMMYKKFSKF